MAGAIPTVFNGIEYRSRLEARWAAFMHNIGWEHTYEPFDGDGYIPDFIVHGQSPLVIEVKPAITQADYEREVPKVDRGLGDYQHDVMIVGANPFVTGGFGNSSYVAAGWLGEVQFWPGEQPVRSWEAADWFKCGECDRISVYHTIMCFYGRPCGHYDGDHHLGTPPIKIMRSMWADACNEVKWRGRAA
jgi:hypothetical protein